MNLKSYVLQEVDAEIYYKSRFQKWSRTSGNVLCPWHQDTKPSLSIGLHNGGARCHACGKAVGNIVHFEAESTNQAESAVALTLYAEFIRPIVPEQTLAALQSGWNKAARAALLKDTALNDKDIERHQLGWCAVSKRIAIPILDRWGNCINVRMYKLPSHRSKADEAYKVLNLKGYGGTDLFPWTHFTDYTLDKPIFVMASEKEVMLGIQGGLQCVCATAGERAWPSQWTELFTGYEICIVAQRDRVGRESADAKLASLQTVATFAAVVEPDTKLKDFADYVVQEGGQALSLLAKFKLLTKGISAIAPAVGESHPSFSDNSPALPAKFSDAVMELADIGSRPEMLNRIVKTQGIIAAKATITFTIPWKFRVTIKGDAQRYYSLPMGRVLLSFVKASDTVIRCAVRDILGNDKAELLPESYITAIEVEVIPTANVTKDVPYVTQRCYYMGNRIEANVPYELEIIPTTDARTQETVGLIVKATPISRSFETATFTDEEIAALQVFQPTEERDEWETLNELADEMGKYHTRIFERPDWHMVAMLTWFSPIGWMFPFEKKLQRGWINALALGDTQTGKSEVVESLQRITNAGSIISAENCTYVGLVGGAMKMGSGQFMLRWGRIPLCDKQLVVLEELSGLSIEEISNMSDVRSSGVARLDKGGLSAETNARTRLLALSNVRSKDKSLSGYISGVQAVRELIGHGEDIARFDLIITLTDREVPVDVINRPYSNRGSTSGITEELIRKLCQFVWSLKPDQIKITTDAYYLCLEETKRLAEIYHPSVPVFKGGSGRYKICRIAAAIACLQFAWTGKYMRVSEEHILAATKLLQMLYDKASFGYLEWSKQMQDRDGVKDVAVLDEAIISTIPNGIKRGKIVESLIHTSKFTRDELCAVASLQIMQADNLIGVLVRERVLRKGEANVWEITPAGRDWFQTHLNDDNFS